MSSSPIFKWYHQSLEKHLQIFFGVVEAIEVPHSLLQFGGCLKIASQLMEFSNFLDVFHLGSAKWCQHQSFLDKI